MVGRNAIGVELGKSIYDAEKTNDGRYTRIANPPKQLMLRAQLEYDCDGIRQPEIATNTNWKSYLDGPYVGTSWYGGEEYNATLEVQNWPSADGNIDQWEPVSIFKGPSGMMPGLIYPPLQVVELLSAKSVSGPVNGTYIFDFGVNVAGWYSLNINESTSTRIVMRPGEKVKNGTVDQSTSGKNVYDGYTSNGVPFTYRPKFV
ncbi:uncharacterized protein JN550_007100 [Neoarthrinium moseri]|uniref:uncharacterized protein n=1 Tax=Neoarthrinium moseri TaxID=1658444 RepID=UPI001FDD4CCE|nr:uncharacterized protein JN550_007100 [Neoarthrinium moseri]KAI1867369.1 hypothetical protein JN550_007100 [Neoarthrinium moseri]